MKKLSVIVLMTLLFIVGCTGTNSNKTTSDDTEDPQAYDSDFQKSISRIDKLPNAPENYKILDFKEIARKYDALVFDDSSTGNMMPLLTWDYTATNTNLEKVPSIPSYVGASNQGTDNSQEAINVIASYLSASLVGIDKSNQNGYNYIAAMDNFYKPSEKVVLNNPNGSSSGTSFWYALLPSILYVQVSMLYDDETLIREHALQTIESWFYAHRVMYGRDGTNANYEYNGFDFVYMRPHMNQSHVEPEAAVGIALLMDYGYELTGDEKYKNAAIEALNYIDKLGHSPEYEVLQDFAPFLTAKYNALFGTEFNTQLMFKYLMDGSSPYRNKWGLIVGDFSDSIAGDGLYGSQNDAQGYAFAMNTFNMASAVVPTVKYDSTYANMIGKLILNTANNSRYFFKNEIPEINQSCNYFEPCKDFNSDPEGVIPYEGLRKVYQEKNPYASGDQSVYNWGGKTDFSLYSGSHTGRLAAIIDTTDVSEILKIDLNVTDFTSQSYPTYLLYNPYEATKDVTYYVKENHVDLYDTLKRTIIATDVTDNTKISIDSVSSRVIVEIPHGATITVSGDKVYANDQVIAFNTIKAVLTSHERNDVLTNEATFEFKVYSYDNQEITNIVLYHNNQEIPGVYQGNQLKVSTQELIEGYINVVFKIKTANHVDFVNARFKVEK